MMGLSFDELFPGRFMKSGLFKGRDVTLIIKGVRIEELPDDKGAKKVKGIVTFERTPLELVLNRTNGEALRSMFGSECDAWRGKRVTLYPAPYHDNMTGQDSTCIRVRGSPDIAANITYELRLARKKPVKVVMLRTPSTIPVNGAQQAAPPPPPQPQHDPLTGEVDDGTPFPSDSDAPGGVA